jgi:hypothetical protein
MYNCKDLSGERVGCGNALERVIPCLSLSDLHVGCPSDLAVRLLTVIRLKQVGSSRYIKTLLSSRGALVYFF